MSSETELDLQGGPEAFWDDFCHRKEFAFFILLTLTYISIVPVKEVLAQDERLDTLDTPDAVVTAHLGKERKILRPFKDEDVDVAVEAKIRIYERRKAKYRTKIPDDPEIHEAMTDLLTHFFNIEVAKPVSAFPDVESLICEIMRNYIRDQFLFITMEKLEDKPKPVVAHVPVLSPQDHKKSPNQKPPSAPELTPQRDESPASDPEIISCEGLAYKTYGEHILRVDILDFNDTKLAETLRVLLEQHKSRLVCLNFCDNGGGLLHEAEEFCDIFPGRHLVTVQSDTGREYYTTDADDDVDIPRLFVFFNQYSASASEVVLAHLKKLGVRLFSVDPHSKGKNAHGLLRKIIINGYEIQFYKSFGRIRAGDSNSKITPTDRFRYGFDIEAFFRELASDPDIVSGEWR